MAAYKLVVNDLLEQVHHINLFHSSCSVYGRVSILQ